MTSTVTKAIVVALAVLVAAIVTVTWMRSPPHPRYAAHDDAVSSAAPTALAPDTVAGEEAAPASEPVQTVGTGSGGDPLGATRALGFYEPLMTPQDETTYLRLDPVTRLLTPTSFDDAQWMIAHGYPRRKDVETDSVDDMITELNLANPIQNADRVEYLTNAIAANLYRAKDPRWREYAQASSGSFGAMLELSDLRSQADLDAPVDKYRLIATLARAQVYGEVDAAHLLERTGRLPTTDALELSMAISGLMRQAQYLRRHEILRGQKPLDMSPRPPAPWNSAPTQ